MSSGRNTGIKISDNAPNIYNFKIKPQRKIPQQNNLNGFR